MYADADILKFNWQKKHTEKKIPQETVHGHFNGILILTIVLIKSVMRMERTSQWDCTWAEWSVMGDCYTVMFLGFCGIFHPSFTTAAVFDWLQFSPFLSFVTESNILFHSASGTMFLGIWY